MRMWHKSLISALPMYQLTNQWRDCCTIAKNIANLGTPNFLLVNKVLEYSDADFIAYAMIVRGELERRGYSELEKTLMVFDKYMNEASKYFKPYEEVNHSSLYSNWHTGRYFLQCYLNLQEIYDCGGMTEEDWKRIYKVFVDKGFSYIALPF